MDKLEHDIKKAFAEHDGSTRLSDKGKIWNRLDNAIHRSKGVVAFWRVAAVFLGILMVTGAIAGLSYQGKMKSEIQIFQNQNAQMQITIDSLLARPVEVLPEIKEVEKVVYRDRIIHKNLNETSEWESKYVQLKDSTNRIITQKEKSYLDELQQLKDELESTNEKLLALQNESNKLKQTAKEPFQLKSERVELGIQNTPVTKSPGIEVKILPQSFTGNKNNLNKSLLNNLP